MGCMSTVGAPRLPPSCPMPAPGSHPWVPSPVTPLSPQAVGISVEFVSHLTCAFAHSTKPTRVERAAEATVTMGSKVGAARPRGHPGVLPVTHGCREGTTRSR